jgi:hypothetical protein
MQLTVRGLDRKAGAELRASIQRRLWFVLGRFGRRIGRVTVDLAEQESSNRTRAKRCRIVLRLIRSGKFCVEEIGTDLVDVAERAMHRVGQLVRREIERQREELDGSPTETRLLGPSQ